VLTYNPPTRKRRRILDNWFYGNTISDHNVIVRTLIILINIPRLSALASISRFMLEIGAAASSASSSTGT